MTTSHLTPRILVAVILAAIAIGVPVTAQRVSESELLLREALHKQQVQGDLPGAIKIYQQIVSATNTNRAVAARALLELAGCYEKLGQQAEAVYQRIVRDFGDQPVAVQARARLAALRPAAPAPAMTLRKLDVPGDIMDIAHTDGQRAVFLAGEPERGLALEFGDLSGKERRIVGPRARLWSVSPDLSTVAAYQPQTRQSSIMIMKTDGSGERILELRENGAPLATSGRGPLSMDWSWDNRYLVITNPHETGSRLLRVTVADGTVTEVQPGLRGATQAKFSPDGQFIVYDSLGRIYVLPSGGGESQLIATGFGFPVGWTRDGRHVLIRERTTDGWLLSAVPVQQGRRQGAPIALRSVPGSTIRTMMNGSLFVTTGDRPQAVRDTWLGALDDGAASVTWTPLNLAASPLPQTLTPWSSDGTRFAYVTGNDSQAMRVIRVKNISTGDDRELYRADHITGCVAAHREDVLYCTRVAGEELHVVSVSLESGRAEARGTLRRNLVIEHVTTDDRKIVFLDLGTSSRVEWEIATGDERAVPFYRSEDGRSSLSGGDRLRIRSATDGGDWRFLVVRNFGLRGTQHIGVSNGGAISLVRFSPDGNWVVYHDRDAAGNDGLYRIAADGGEPQRLGDYPATALQTSSLSVSPDGRRFLVSAARPPFRPADFWILENFLPAVPATSAAAAKTGR